MNCTIRFERNGESRKGVRVPANELWLDVGNALEPGCVDHHHIAGYASTLDALVRHPEYLADARRCAGNGQEIVVHLHAAPDLDCVGSYYAFLYYLEHGEDEFTGFFGPEGAGNPFVTYINDIDAGRRKVTDYPTLYAVFSALDDGKARTPQTDLQVVDKGLELLSVALRLLAEQGIDLATCDLSEYLPDRFEKECREVSAYSFEEELDTGRVKFETVPLWKKSGTGMTTEFVQAAIWKHVPASYNSYNAARRRGAVLTVVPYSIKGENGAEYTRVFISVNPDLDPENEYTLRPLAEIIEQLEQMEEERLYEQTGSYRRDHSQPRSREGVFSNMPFAATSDPWFIRPDGSLIDSPRSLSLLEYNGILNVIRNNGSAVKTACTVGIAGKGKENTLLGRWE